VREYISKVRFYGRIMGNILAAIFYLGEEK
jgi:hypothetical protein